MTDDDVDPAPKWRRRPGAPTTRPTWPHQPDPPTSSPQPNPPTPSTPP